MNPVINIAAVSAQSDLGQITEFTSNVVSTDTIPKPRRNTSVRACIFTTSRISGSLDGGLAKIAACIFRR